MDVYTHMSTINIYVYSHTNLAIAHGYTCKYEISLYI